MGPAREDGPDPGPRCSARATRGRLLLAAAQDLPQHVAEAAARRRPGSRPCRTRRRAGGRGAAAPVPLSAARFAKTANSTGISSSMTRATVGAGMPVFFETALATGLLTLARTPAISPPPSSPPPSVATPWSGGSATSATAWRTSSPSWSSASTFCWRSPVIAPTVVAIVSRAPAASVPRRPAISVSLSSSSSWSTSSWKEGSLMPETLRLR